MAFTVREVQATPNPNAMKFVLDRQITSDRLSFSNSADAAGHPLAARLFEVDGVAGLMLMNDFVTVLKTPAAKWGSIKANVKKMLNTEFPD